MDLDQALALITFAFAASVTPGPNNAMLLASGVNYGFRRTLPHLFGINVGFPIMIGAIGLGIGQILQAEPRIYAALKVVSVLYLLWLAWKIAAADPKPLDGGAMAGKPMSFLQAAAFQWVNPKAWIMIIGAYAAYSVPGRPVLSALLVSGAFIAVGVPSSSVWAGFGLAVRRLLGTARRVRVFNVVMGLLLVASILPVIVDLIELGGWRVPRFRLP